MLGELLHLDDSYLWSAFFAGFLLPLGTNVTASMSSESFVWMMA